MPARSLLCAALLLSASATVRADDEEQKNTLKSLQGDWKLLSAKRGGKAESPFGDKEVTLTVKNDEFAIGVAERKETTKVKIDASKSPTQIDFVNSSGKASSHGILKLEGKKLTICFTRTREERPSKFESKEDTRTFLLVFEKQAASKKE